MDVIAMTPFATSVHKLLKVRDEFQYLRRHAISLDCFAIIGIVYSALGPCQQYIPEITQHDLTGSTSLER